MKNILLHICCGVCASSVVQKLQEENFYIIGFFYNPNIYCEQEYKKRIEFVYKVSQILKFDLIEGEYDYDKWFNLTKDFKKEPEGKTRCEICYKMRLKETYKKLQELKFSYFATTLSVSPHKNVLIINKIGKELDEKAFLEKDFKKQDGFKKAIEFSKQHNFYRQNYCGCIYSKKFVEK
ncbi:MAG: epoxyqueuosine reductase QueH [bacterium]